MNDPPSTPARRITMRALLLGDRIETAGLERNDVLSTVPLAFRAGEKDRSRAGQGRPALAIGNYCREGADDRAHAADRRRARHQRCPGARRKNVAKVFDVIQPIARELAEHGRTPGGRRAILKHIGNALLVQHRVSGLVAVAEKPDGLWERPSLKRFYARLEDEYELKERADVLTRKLTVISDSAKAFADIIDTERSARLELIIVVLIVLEIVIGGLQLWIH